MAADLDTCYKEEVGPGVMSVFGAMSLFGTSTGQGWLRESLESADCLGEFGDDPGERGLVLVATTPHLMKQ